jgi:hypothetical protein
MTIRKEEEATLYAEFLINPDGWGYIAHDNWALWKTTSGKWLLDSDKGLQQEITELAAKLLLEQYDLETDNLPES